MDSATPTDVLLASCRFLCSRSDFDRLLPGLEFEIPVPQDLGGGLGVGWPLRPPAVLTAALFEYVSGQVQGVLKPGTGAAADGYFHTLESVLFDAVAQAPGARLDTILWLWLLDVVPRLLNGDRDWLAWFEHAQPDVLRAHRGPIDELTRLGRRSPAQHAATKREVLSSIDGGHELIASDLRQRAGEASEHLLSLAGQTPVLQLAEPDGFFTNLDLTPIFLGREGFVDSETFGFTRRLVEAIVDSTWRRRAGNRAGSGERWALEYFLRPELIERAELLDESSIRTGAGANLTSRIATLGALQPDFVEYLLHHCDQFSVDPETASRYGVTDDQLGLLADPESLALRAPGYRDVTEELLRWDALNAARAMVRIVDVESGAFVIDGHPVSERVFVLDLEEAAPPAVPPPAPPEPPLDDAAAAIASAFGDYGGGFEDPSGTQQPQPEENEYGAFGDLFAGNAGFEDQHDGFQDQFGAGIAGVPAVSAPRSKQAVSPSLLGVLEADFAVLLQEYELGPQSLPPEGVPEVRVARPDFGVLFEDYMIFPIGRLITPGSAIGIGRRHRHQIFDLHLFAVPRDPGWRPEQAVDEFMRAKVSANFVPLAFEYAEIPPDAGPMEPLTPRRLERAFQRVARPSLEFK